MKEPSRDVIVSIPPPPDDFASPPVCGTERAPMRDPAWSDDRQSPRSINECDSLSVKSDRTSADALSVSRSDGAPCAGETP